MGIVVPIHREPEDGEVVYEKPRNVYADLELGCDWGWCNRTGVAWRWCAAMKLWLVVCRECRDLPRGTPPVG